MRLRGISGALIALFVLTACSSAPVHEPASPTTLTGHELPPRPQEIRIDDLDPCSVFTPEQLRTLDVSGQRATRADERRGPLCQWSHVASEPFEGYLVLRTTDQGPETAYGNPNGTTVTTVAGFPAVETQALGGGGDDHCMILVGVADGQTLQVQYDYNGTKMAMTRAQACEKARAAAEMATRTLIDRAGGGR